MHKADVLYTLGHSNHAFGHFVALLRRHAVETVADVRSRPFSRFVPHFSKDRLAALLEDEGIGYLYLGRELGGKPVRDDPPVTRLDYAARVEQPAFQAGVARLLEAAGERRAAMICRERDPLDRHRLHLIARYIRPMVGEINHILPDGRIEDHATTERRLVERAGAAVRGDDRGARQRGHRARLRALLAALKNRVAGRPRVVHRRLRSNRRLPVTRAD